MSPAALSRRPLILLASGACTVSLAPILVKAITRTGMQPMTIGMWRCLLGGALLFVLARTRGASVATSPRLTWLLVLAGLAFAVDLTVWHNSIVLAGAGMATILGNTQVFFTAAFSALLFGERLTARFALAAVAALFGVVLLVGLGSDVAFDERYLRGIGFGLATGLVYGIFLTVLRGAGRVGGGSALVRPAWFALYAGLFLAGGVGASSEVALPPSSMAWLLVVGLAVLAQVVGWTLISGSLPHVPGSSAGLVLLLQPVLATLWSALLFGETLAALQIAGATVTLAAIYLGSTGRSGGSRGSRGSGVRP